jgi:hypothetical protein
MQDSADNSKNTSGYDHRGLDLRLPAKSSNSEGAKSCMAIWFKPALSRYHFSKGVPRLWMKPKIPYKITIHNLSGSSVLLPAQNSIGMNLKHAEFPYYTVLNMEETKESALWWEGGAPHRSME